MTVSLTQADPREGAGVPEKAISTAAAAASELPSVTGHLCGGGGTVLPSTAAAAAAYAMLFRS